MATPPLERNVTQRAVSRCLVLWASGLAAGLVGGFASLVVTPLLALPEIAILVLLVTRRPRLAVVAGTLVGQGAAAVWLLLITPIYCADSLPPDCGWSLQLRLASPTDEARWITAQSDLFFASLVILIAGVALTGWVAMRVRRSRPLYLAP